MPVVSDNIPNLINGVSQQAPTIRLPSQAEEQINCMSSIVDGLQKRHPLEWISKLTGTTYGDSLVHTINRDSVERYTVLFVNGDLFVYSIADGTSKTVNFPDGKTYLSTSTPSTSIQVMTIADYTFIANNEIDVEMDSGSLTDSNDNIGFVFVQQAVNGVEYKVTIESTSYTHTTSTTGAVSTSAIASALATAIGTGPGANYTVTQINHVLEIKRNSATDFELATEDARSGEALSSFKDKVQRFSDLPLTCTNDYIMEIQGTDSTQFDNYFVKFETHDGGDRGEGTWVETVAPGIEYQFDASTMPHVLVRESSGDFTFKEATWSNREVGDAESNKNPSFVGSPINEIFLHKNRLGFLSKDNSIKSESGEFFNFFRTTVTTLLDSDPIDVNASHTKVGNLYHAVPYSEKLILFSDQTQFVLEGGDTLTAETVSIQPTTEFGCSTTCKPVGAGQNVYFITDRGDYSAVREYFVNDDTNTKDAAEITAHIPKYIPKNVHKIASSPNEDILCLFSSDEPSNIYVYKYFWDKDNKLQSSWSTWSFGTGYNILSGDFISDTLYLTVQRSDGIHLCRIRVSPKLIDAEGDYLTHLDLKITEDECSSVSYDAGTHRTTFSLPYSVTGTFEVVVRSDGDFKRGTRASVVSASSTSVIVSGDYSSEDVYIGQQYEMSYTFSPFYIRRPSQQGGIQTITRGRLQLRTLQLSYADTGYFTLEVTPLYRDTSVYKMTGRITGAGSNVIGSVAIDTGSFSSLIQARNTAVTLVIKNDSPLPSNITGATWEGYYHSRSA